MQKHISANKKKSTSAWIVVFVEQNIQLTDLLTTIDTMKSLPLDQMPQVQFSRYHFLRRESKIQNKFPKKLKTEISFSQMNSLSHIYSFIIHYCFLSHHFAKNNQRGPKGDNGIKMTPILILGLALSFFIIPSAGQSKVLW